GAGGDLAAVAVTRRPAPPAADGAGDDQDRDRDDQPERGGEPVELPVRILDRELYGILLPGWFHSCLPPSLDGGDRHDDPLRELDEPARIAPRCHTTLRPSPGCPPPTLVAVTGVFSLRSSSAFARCSSGRLA